MVVTDLFPDAPIPLPAQISEVERELAMRRRVYPGWVAAKKMSQTAADRQVRVMEAVLTTLRERANG